jgi:glycosyltransferase involved in cell wall biosynthesis
MLTDANTIDAGKECKITVGIPVYNCEEYISQCLTSVQTQSLIEIEIICVDDGSTDKTSDILYQFAAKDSRIKIIKNQTNQGISKSRNHIINAANGEYIYFLDGDDFILPDALLELYTASIKQELDILTFNSDFYYTEPGISEAGRKNPKLEGDYNGVLSGAEFFCRLNENGEYRVAVWRSIFRREFLKNHQISFDDNIKCYEDAPFALACYLYASRIAYVNKVYHSYRIRPGSIVSGTDDINKFLGFFMGYAVKLQLLHRFQTDDPRLRTNIYKRVQRARMNAISHYKKIDASIRNSVVVDGSFYETELYYLFTKSFKQDITLSKLKALRLTNDELQRQIQEIKPQKIVILRTAEVVSKLLKKK